jgi:WD40 repeat protein
MPALPAAMYGELSADGSWLALTVGSEVQLFRLPTAEDGTIAPYRRPRTAAVLRPDGGAILTAGPDGVVQVLSIEDQRWIFSRSYGGTILGAAWSPNGDRAALLLPFDRRVVVVDVEHESPPLEISYTDGLAPAIVDLSEQPTPAFSADGLRLAAPVSGSAVAVWDAFTGTRLATLQGHDGMPISAAFSPTGHGWSPVRRRMSGSGTRWRRLLLQLKDGGDGIESASGFLCVLYQDQLVQLGRGRC